MTFEEHVLVTRLLKDRVAQCTRCAIQAREDNESTEYWDRQIAIAQSLILEFRQKAEAEF